MWWHACIDSAEYTGYVFRGTLALHEETGYVVVILCLLGVYTEYMNECIDKPKGGAQGVINKYILYTLQVDIG